MIHRRINYVDPPRYSYGGSILSGAASGAATGSMFGPWGTAIGAVAGGAMGYFKENKLQSAQDEQKRKEEELIAKQQLFLNKQADRQILSQFPTYGVNQSFFKYGGNIGDPPRVKAYNDSLYAYNTYINAKKFIENNPILNRNDYDILINMPETQVPLKIKNISPIDLDLVNPNKNFPENNFITGENGENTDTPRIVIPQYKKPINNPAQKIKKLPSKQATLLNNDKIPAPNYKNVSIFNLTKENTTSISGKNHGYYDSRSKNKDWGTLTDETGKTINISYEELDKMSDQEIKDFFGSFKNQEFYADRFIQERNKRNKKSLGGYTTPQYEAEGNEVIEHSANLFKKPKVFSGGNLKKLSNTTSVIEGKSHAEGGIPMSGGERIFSDKLPAPIQLLKLSKKL